MLQKLARSLGTWGRPQNMPIEKEPSHLTYGLCDFDFGSVVERLGDIASSAIVKRKNGYAYVVGYGLKGSEWDSRAMERAKRDVIDTLVADGADPATDVMGSAYHLAKAAILRYADAQTADKLYPFVAHDIAGHGPLSLLLLNKTHLEEIEVNSPDLPLAVYTKKYGRCVTNLKFKDAGAFRYDINRMILDSEKELSEDSPIIDVQHGDARVHAQIYPYVRSGAAASIRLGKEDGVSADLLLRNGTMDAGTLAYLWFCVASGLNIVISGAPASGKTTMLNTLLGLVPRGRRIIAVEEDIHEISLKDYMNSVSLYGEKGRVTTKEQVINALRLRPDCLIIGEIRGEEARDLFSGANLGIQFLTTMHSPDDSMGVIRRLMTRPMGVDTKSISMLDLSIHLSQFGTIGRRITRVYEYNWLSRAETDTGINMGDQDKVRIDNLVSDGTLLTNDLKDSKAIRVYAKIRGISVRLAAKEFERQKSFIEMVIAKNAGIDGFSEELARHGCGI